MSKSPVLFSSDDEDAGPRQEVEILRKFQTMLQGVPPPYSITMCKISVAEMLSKFKENESDFGFGTQETSAQKFSRKKNTTPLVYYLNSSDTSEGIAALSQRVQSRYVYSETLSSCNVWFDSTVEINSAKKRSDRRNVCRVSPGSRLSHLARRRQIFSCANLQQLANSDRRRHIEIKKNDVLKMRNLELNKTVEFEKINSSKRALFMSPDNEDTKKNNCTSNLSYRRDLFNSSEKIKGLAPGNSKNVEVSRWLSQQNFKVGSSKIRKRLESRDGTGNWPRRALTFTEEDSDKSLETHSRDAKVISDLQLSLHHKNKLLWAVSLILKEKKMSSKDAHFKTCASALFMICRKNLEKILSSKVEGGTSEKMLHFARGEIDGIFMKLGISKDDAQTQINLDSVNYSKEINGSSNNSEKKATISVENSINTERISTSDSAEQNLNKSCQTEVVCSSINEKENIDVFESGESSCTSDRSIKTSVK